MTLALAAVIERLKPAFMTATAERIADSAIVFGSSEYEMALRAAAKARGVAATAPGLALTRAAVLVGFVDRADGPTVLLTQRTAHLADHAGQVSFPGGRVEEEDADITAAALREAEEEVGLRPSSVEVAGTLEDHGTVSGFRVTPVVGVIRPPVAFVPHVHEVVEAFEVPLAFFLDPANRRIERRLAGGRVVYAFPYDGRNIWGFTARILVRIADIVNDVRS